MKLNLRKSIMLHEQFMNNVNEESPVVVDAPAVSREIIIKDVDTILTNLSKLSDQIQESYMLNEDAMASLMAGIKSQFAIAKSTMMLPKYKKLLIYLGK